MPIKEAAWEFATMIIGVGQLFVGIAMLLDGSDAFENPVLDGAAFMPWWVWGISAIISASLIRGYRTRTYGLSLAALWYSLWASVIIVGVGHEGSPLYAIPVYLMFAALHVLFAAVEITDQKNLRRIRNAR